jgi:ABC-2 type transport system ATP-binding protein
VTGAPAAVPAIEADDLRRDFRARTGWLRRQYRTVHAVRDVSLRIERGTLFGLLGPNGAGKTTTIKMLNTLLIPTSGSARILGFDVVREPREVRRRIGFVSGGDRGLYDRLSGLDNLRYFAELYAVDARDQRRRIGELLELVGLAGRERERVEGYSRGMRQRLHIARGMLHSPQVLFLDEPSLGVDPVAARELRRTVAELVSTGVTVLLTTHYMAEAEELCDRIAVIADGRIQAIGTAADLTRHAEGRKVLAVEAYGVAEAHLDRLRQLTGVRGVTVEDRGPTQLLSVQSDGDVDVQDGVFEVLREIRLGRVETRTPTLEDAYVSIVTAAEQAATAGAAPTVAVSGPAAGTAR